MRISGISQLTTIDYPWKLACVIFTQWCNLRCPFCYNPENVLPELIAKNQDLIQETAFFNFLDSKKGKLDWVSICGWEPTLQADLYDFAKKIKSKWFLVKLDTNGRDSEIVKKMFQDGVLDYVAIDIKNTNSKLESTTWIKTTNQFLESFWNLFEFLQDNDYDYEYRTTLIKWLHTPQNVEEIAKTITGVKKYFLQNYMKSTTLDPNFDWKSFPPDELEDLQTICKKYIPNCKIRS